MEIKQSIVQSLSLELKLTPALIQNIELLQIPLIELENIVKNEIETNPLIEIEEPEEKEEKKEETSTESVWDFVVDGGNVFLNEEERFDPLTIKASKISVKERLIHQAKLEFDREIDFEIAKFIIENLDNRGFLTLPLEEIANRFKTTVEHINEIRDKVQRFDPVGCASTSLIECFKVQAEELGTKNKFIKAIEHLELLKKNRKLFKDKANFSDEEFEEFINFLKHLDPQPGYEDETVVIVPDVKVRLINNNIKVEILKTRTFSFKINSSYLKAAETEELKKYLSEKYQRAINLKNAIEQRNKTLKEITEAVFEHQKEFLIEGEEAIKPLSYKEIAEKINIHESTISRAVKDKFVDTPHGVYPLKAFFKRGISGQSTDSIRNLIKEIIENEDKKKPLSDSKIAKLLQEKGIKIARRTVAKYREELGIPGVFERKEK